MQTNSSSFSRNAAPPRLSVNINKIALLRNARGGNLPDLLHVAKDCETFGADGITVHPRPDQRHIRYADIPLLKAAVTTELNIEGNPTESFTRLVLQNRPHQVTLVPDAPNALTSSEGWDTIAHAHFLTHITQTFQREGIRVSIFISPLLQMVEGAKRVGADRVEFYTGEYAKSFAQNPDAAVAPYRLCAKLAQQIGIGVNAGHDLNLQNLSYFSQQLPNLAEVSIGHALVCDALYQGLHTTIRAYKNALNNPA